MTHLLPEKVTTASGPRGAPPGLACTPGVRQGRRGMPVPQGPAGEGEPGWVPAQRAATAWRGTHRGQPGPEVHAGGLGTVSGGETPSGNSKELTSPHERIRTQHLPALELGTASVEASHPSPPYAHPREGPQFSSWSRQSEGDRGHQSMFPVPTFRWSPT